MQELIVSRVREAYANRTPVFIRGQSSKLFYGEPVQSDISPLLMAEYKGITEYEPDELFISARAGTTIREINDVLQQRHQILPFEPPHFGTYATLGGCLACGLSGPARMARGAVRDAILGTIIINGKAEVLRFGGRVMKNVAGYDVSRLMCGAMGTLGLILEATFRLLPMPEFESSLCFHLNEYDAIQKTSLLIQQNLPVSASFHNQDNLYIRFSGYEHNIRKILSTQKTAGGRNVEDGDSFWQNIREQQHPFFTGDKPLWRLSVPPGTAPLDLPGEQAFEWNGAQRWLRSDTDPVFIRNKVEQARGHACLFRGSYNSHYNGNINVFHPLKPEMMKIHQEIKQAFDPARILNPGRLYPGI